ncbi:type III polyketide synthase [Jiulongibacter sp. NS-SX5]|uniref:type III polyketide synthase n=1 Tax=Jiulongibacter sp. NS-SX5 TaxID=3463854 RepID=UPI00405A47F9
MSYLNHIQTADAPFLYPQGEMVDWLLKEFNTDEQRKYKWVLTHAGINTRRCVLPDFQEDSLEKVLYIGRENPGVKSRMKVFEEESAKIIGEIQSDFFKASELKASEITHLITVSCTGISAPGLDFQILKQLKLNTSVQRFGINFMGCYAAFHALKLANYICQSESKAKVLIVDVELCSLHFQTGKSEDEVLANGLFSDGAAMALVSNQEKGLKLKRFFQETAPNSSDYMAWELTSHQFEMKLSTYVPSILSEYIGQFFKKNNSGGVTDFAIHPGGKKILEECAKALHISDNSMAASLRILAEYGNMSSATILYVLKDKMKASSGSGDIFAASFGPGLTMEGAILAYS